MTKTVQKKTTSQNIIRNNRKYAICVLFLYLPRSIPVQRYWKRTNPSTNHSGHTADEAAPFNCRISPVHARINITHQQLYFTIAFTNKLTTDNNSFYC